jgi:hypothetical protein
MTALRRFPDAVPSARSSGRYRNNLCSLRHREQWSDMQGLLAVAALKGVRLLLMHVGSNGAVPDPDASRRKAPDP